jgi:hypothetical protein
MYCSCDPDCVQIVSCIEDDGEYATTHVHVFCSGKTGFHVWNTQARRSHFENEQIGDIWIQD